MSSRPQGGSCFSLRIFFFVSRHLPPCPIFLVEPILQVLPLDMRGMGGVHPLGSRKSGGLFSLLPYFLTSLLPYFFFFNDRATCLPCRGAFSYSAAAPSALFHRWRQSSRLQFPSRRRATACRSDCRTSRKSSRRRLPRICTRPLPRTISPARIPDALRRPPSRRAWPRSLSATYPAAQFPSRNRAGARPRRAARRHISPLPFRSSRFFPPASHSQNSRTPPRPSRPDKHFFAAQPHRLLPGRESRLPDTPCHTTWRLGCTSSFRCGSVRLFARDIHSRGLPPSSAVRFPRRKYVPPCWDTENPRDSRSRTPRDAAPFPARRSRPHPRASDDTPAASRRGARSKSGPAAAAFSCARCAP